MVSDINIFGKAVPVYGLCFYFGAALAASIGFFICRYKKFSRWELVYSGIFAMIGAVIGAKLLFIAVSIKNIIKYNIPIAEIIKGGFVFYGGLIGGFLGLAIYTKMYKLKIVDYLDIFAAVLPLGHAIGRVGCFFAGCCYGKPSHFGVIYAESAGLTPLNVKLFPIQLVEATCLLILFFITVIVYKKSKHGATTVLVYLSSYSVIRFVLEFFRGDAERGGILFFSTSQWICIVIAASTVITALKRKLCKMQ